MRTLHLVSPHMRGADVKHVQTALRSHGWYHGALDGEYGPLTAQAVHRAKFRLGYTKPDQVAGDLLFGFLNGHRKPTALMRALAAKRQAADKRKQKKPAKHGLTHGQMIVKLALTQLGQTEHPSGSNRSKFSLWYGIVGAWCAMFVTWLYVTAKLPGITFKRAIRYAYVPFIVGDARAGHNGLMLWHGPASGIVLAFDWDHNGVADHTGVAADEADLKQFAPHAFAEALREFGPLGPGEFWTVEGNTGVGNDSNGGQVMIRKRPRSLVQAFIKVAA